MLSAILHGKKKGTGLAGIRLKIGETPGAEDVLTATIFERISYLPEEVFKQFINNLLGYDAFGYLYDLEFWPSWEIEDYRVEPDAVLFDATEQVINVEAKRYDKSRQQDAHQLANEILASSNMEIKNPILLIIGGMSNYDEKEINNVKKQIDIELTKKSYKGSYRLCAKSWQNVYLTLEQAIQEAMNTLSLQRLLADIRAAYDWHGIRHKPMQWLSDIKPQHLTHGDFPSFLGQRNPWKSLQPVYLNYEKFPSFLGEHS